MLRAMLVTLDIVGQALDRWLDRTFPLTHIKANCSQRSILNLGLRISRVYLFGIASLSAGSKLGEVKPRYRPLQELMR